MPAPAQAEIYIPGLPWDTSKQEGVIGPGLHIHKGDNLSVITETH